jgi:ABC-type antimicrobial peptide transport system permease subunit
VAQGASPPDGWVIEGSAYSLDGVVMALRPRDVEAGAAILDEELSVVAPTLRLKYAGTLLDWQIGESGGRQIATYRTMMIVLAATALALVLIGLVGIVADGIVRRTREVGIRKALGGGSLHVAWVLAREGVVAAATGLVFGVIAVAFVGPALTKASSGFRRMLLGETWGDWRLLLPLGSAVLAVVVLVSLICAARANRIQPMVALKGD